MILRSKLSSSFAVKFIVDLDCFFSTILKQMKVVLWNHKCIWSYFSWERNMEENWTLVSASLEIKRVIDVCVLNLSSWLASALHFGGAWYHVNVHLIGSPVPRQDKVFCTIYWTFEISFQHQIKKQLHLKSESL